MWSAILTAPQMRADAAQPELSLGSIAETVLFGGYWVTPRPRAVR
jgi:hypothetical protein